MNKENEPELLRHVVLTALHDLNNILASMTGYTEFLLDDLAPESRPHHFAGKLMAGETQAKEIVAGLLEIVKKR
jgi:hypothetical protein